MKGSIGEGPNHSNHSNHSNSFKIQEFSVEISKNSENFNIPKLTVAMVPAPLSDSQESNWRMNSARDQEHYVTRRIPRTPTFCRLRPEDARCRSTSTRVCAGVSKRKATLKITATKRRGLVATRNCERSRSHYSAHGQRASIPLSAQRRRSSWPPEGKIGSRRPRRRGAALMGSGR